MEKQRPLRFSWEMVPDHPVAELLSAIELCDRLDYYAVYGSDETYHKDMWQIFAAAAVQTERVRFGPDVTHVILRDPTMIAQQIATLDEMSNGRAECGYSIGNFAMLEQYHIAEAAARPIKRLREAHHVMRTMLDNCAIEFAGEYYQYSGLFTTAKPLQQRLPIFLGAMVGPRTFELAGEICDGMHHALAYSIESLDYAVEHIKVGANRAGRDWQTLDIGTMVVATVGRNSRAAKEAARVLAAFYLSATPPVLLERHGIDPLDAQPIVDAFNSGDVAEGIRRMPAELSDKFTLAGTPEEVVEQLKGTVEPSGFNHVIFVISDPFTVNTWSGMTIDDVPDLAGQLQLINDEVIPAFR